MTPLVRRARNLTRNAIKAGSLVPEPCALCAVPETVHGHHENYRRPLAVVWLCAVCHRQRHASGHARLSFAQFADLRRAQIAEATARVGWAFVGRVPVRLADLCVVARIAPTAFRRAVPRGAVSGSYARATVGHLFARRWLERRLAPQT